MSDFEWNEPKQVETASEVKQNLLAEDRGRLLERFPSHCYKKAGHVVH